MLHRRGPNLSNLTLIRPFHSGKRSLWRPSSLSGIANASRLLGSRRVHPRLYLRKCLYDQRCLASIKRGITSSPSNPPENSNNNNNNLRKNIDTDELELAQLVADLSRDPAYAQVVSEIGALRSIYGNEGNDSIRVWKSNGDGSIGDEGINADDIDKVVRYVVHLGLPLPYDVPDPETPFMILVSLPRTYPSSSAPQFELLSHSIGPFSVDAALRTFVSSRGDAEWLPGTECVFDGLENVRERVAVWYNDRLGEEKVQEFLREERRHERESTNHTRDPVPQASLPEGLSLSVAEPIVDRKSVFIGRACRISHPSQVFAVLSHLMADRRIARASHPIIHAWRCRVDGVLHQGSDDNGETAAGGRLAHLLQLLDVENVLVIVTRYFGGTLLGPKRFKYINQVARNALELGGFLDAPDERRNSPRLKKKG